MLGLVGYEVLFYLSGTGAVLGVFVVKLGKLVFARNVFTCADVLDTV